MQALPTTRPSRGCDLPLSQSSPLHKWNKVLHVVVCSVTKPDNGAVPCNHSVQVCCKCCCLLQVITCIHEVTKEFPAGWDLKALQPQLLSNAISGSAGGHASCNALSPVNSLWSSTGTMQTCG